MAIEYDVVSERAMSGNDRFHTARNLKTDVRGAFIHAVERALNDGWKLQEGIATDNQGYLLQALYREVDG
jgi:hypothetical protein